MLTADAEVQARRARVEEVLRHVCEEEEFPYFVSDEATLLDVCTLMPEEIAERLAQFYGRRVQLAELRPPIWKLVDWLDAAST
jgi:hypothetical protein